MNTRSKDLFDPSRIVKMRIRPERRSEWRWVEGKPARTGWFLFFPYEIESIREGWYRTDNPQSEWDYRMTDEAIRECRDVRIQDFPLMAFDRAIIIYSLTDGYECSEYFETTEAAYQKIEDIKQKTRIQFEIINL
jgi:hypothetical protein